MAVTAARDLMLTQFEHADAAEPVLEMEKRMDAQRLGAMLVRSDQGRITAVVTKRALVELRREGVDLTGLSAGEVARGVTPVEARQSPAQAFESLRGQEVGRLPVVDDGVELGIITRGDILLYQAIERSLGDKVADLVVEVSPNDEMFHGNLAGYLSTGVSAVAGVKHALDVARTEAIGSILDFGCGHGRVLRVLKAEFPHAELAACDINEDGVHFCARAFGAKPFRSHRDPEQIELTEQFDLVWCGSLLTHLDAVVWGPFLGLFESVMRPSGMLVFTVMGRGAVPGLRAGTLPGAPRDEERVTMILDGYEETGFGYSDYMGQPGYGLSLCTPEWVRHAIETRDRLRLVQHKEDALGVQDIVACQLVS